MVSLLTGARTEELRALTWTHVDLNAAPPCIMVWRSVRAGGETKTGKSRRTLQLPQRCVDALLLHRDSLLSDAGVPVEKIACLVGHTGTATTELVYRKQIRPVVTGGAAVLDQLFPRRNGDA